VPPGHYGLDLSIVRAANGQKGRGILSPKSN